MSRENFYCGSGDALRLDAAPLALVPVEGMALTLPASDVDRVFQVQCQVSVWHGRQMVGAIMVDGIASAEVLGSESPQFGNGAITIGPLVLAIPGDGKARELALHWRSTASAGLANRFPGAVAAAGIQSPQLPVLAHGRWLTALQIA